MVILELIQTNPRISIILISFIASIFITVVRYFLTDREKMKEIKDKHKKLREEMKEFKNNPEKMLEINKKMMEDLPEQMKQSFKPMIITLIPLLILFKWLWSTYAETAIADTWLWWYIIVSIIFSIILNKVFGMN